MDWQLYERLLGGIGRTSRDNAIDNALNGFLSGIQDDPSYRGDAIVNGIQKPLIMSRVSTTECSIKTTIDSNLRIGDMIKCLDGNWIVVDLFVDKIGLVNATAWLCNNIIRFQNYTPDIYTKHCVVDNGTYSKNSDQDALIMTNTYKLYIPIDSETERLHIDKRLGFGRIYSSQNEEILEVYKIIGVDNKSKNFGEGSHLMVLTLQRDVYNPQTDSILDNLCDVYKDVTPEIDSTQYGTCFITGKDNIRIGTTRKFVAQFVDKDGNIVDNINPEWSVDAPAAITYELFDDYISINIPLDSRLVGEIISISLTDTNNIYGICEKKVQVITVG